MTHGVVSQDEIELMKAVFNGSFPRDAGDTLSIPPKRVQFLCEKWTRKGWYDYGVAVDLGWLTDHFKFNVYGQFLNDAKPN